MFPHLSCFTINGYIHMINNRKDLKTYIREDKNRWRALGFPRLKDWILHNEKWYIHQYLVALRHVEYYINTCKTHNLLFYWWWYWYKYYGFKTHITVYPNTCREGLYIPHIGDMIWVKSSARIGKNSTLRPGVVIGKKGNEKAEEMPVVIGDNCNFGLGVKVFGKLVIGNNVTIGANSVVTRSIPNNVVVAGAPAKILKINH